MLEVVSRQMPKRSVQVQKRRKSTCWQHLHSRALRCVVSKGPCDVSIVRGHRGGAWEPVVDLPAVLSVEKWSVSTMYSSQIVCGGAHGHDDGHDDVAVPILRRVRPGQAILGTGCNE